MLKKINRLNRKDINFLFRNQNIIYWKYFSFFYYKQYPNRKYNQFSIQVPTKLSKLAVDRNYIKRILMHYIRENSYDINKFGDKYYKIFVIFNKKYIPEFKKKIETKEKKVIYKTIIENFRFSFNNINIKLWNK